MEVSNVYSLVQFGYIWSSETPAQVLREDCYVIVDMEKESTLFGQQSCIWSHGFIISHGLVIVECV